MVQQHSLQFQVQDALQLKLRKECTGLQETLTELQLKQQHLPTVNSDQQTLNSRRPRPQAGTRLNSKYKDFAVSLE